jgi:hypothetical protein
MTVATGMKLDTKINGATGRSREALRVAVVLVALAGVIPSSPAAGLTGLVDPTRPAFTAAAGTTGAVARPRGPELHSTFISATQRRAMISGKSYVVGDKFGGGTITDIQPYEVVLKKADRETRMRLLPKLTKEMHIVKVPADGQEGGKK